MIQVPSNQLLVGMAGDNKAPRYLDRRKGVNLGVHPKAGRRVQLVDARSVVQNCLDEKRYLVILRQYFFNPNSDETLLAKYKIECYGVKVYSRPRVFGGKQLVGSREQGGNPIKLGIS